MARNAHSKQTEKSVDSKTDVAQPNGGGYDREQVARLAYSYWEARGFQGGSAEDDWYRAESELAPHEANAPVDSASQDRPLAHGAAASAD